MAVSRRHAVAWGIAAVAVIALATGSVAAAAERLTYCGTVKAYEAPSASRPGSITIGTRTLGIAAGVVYAAGVGDLAGVAGGRCVSGEIDDARRFARVESAHPFGSVGASGVTYGACGTVSDYRPPALGAPGLLVLQELGQEIVVPAGTQLPLAPGAHPGYRCFSAGLDRAGDAIITGIAPVIGAGGSPVPTIPALPATSSGPDGLPAAPIAVVLALVVVSALLPALRLRRR